MDKQIIRECLVAFNNFVAPYTNKHQELVYKARVKIMAALAELDTPASQSARDVATKWIDIELSEVQYYGYEIRTLADAIQAYADRRVQEALEKERAK